MKNNIKIDLGCGKTKKEGYVGIDKYQMEGVDILCDFEKEKLPFEDNSVDRIYASNVLEHIDNIFFLMEECYRILKPDGMMKILVPHYKSRIAFQDPTHIRFFTETTFKYFGKNIADNYYDSQKKCNFKQSFLRVEGTNHDNLMIHCYLKPIK